MKKLKTGNLFSIITTTVLFVVLLGTGCEMEFEKAGQQQIEVAARTPQSMGIIVSAGQVTEAKLAEWRNDGISVALTLTDDSNRKLEQQAAEAIHAAGLKLGYFIEVGRCPELAESHPQWMASLQGHQAWRKQFPDVPIPSERQVIKNFPWVPILYQESFDAHLKRIRQLLVDKPKPQRIWLNDLQGAPSACGCGHPLCRWTADYGPIKTAKPLDHNAAAAFVRNIKKMAPGAEIIPIFVGECEAADKDTTCCGIGCFEGECWKEFTKQLDALATESDQIAVACFYQLFERDLDRYGEQSGWVSFSLNSFSEMPRLRNGLGVTPDRLIAVLQGWDASPSQIESQISQAKTANAAGWLISTTSINQSWQPVVYNPPAESIEDSVSPARPRPETQMTGRFV